MRSRQELLDLLNKAAELGIPSPPDVLLELARQDMEARLQAYTPIIQPEDLPLITLLKRGALPPPLKPGLVFISNNEGGSWERFLRGKQTTIYQGGGGGGAVLSPILQALSNLPNATGYLHNTGPGIVLSWAAIAGGGHVIYGAGAPFPAEPILDFAGAGVTVTDVPGVKTLVTIPGGGAPTDYVHDTGDIMTGDLRGTDFIATRSITITYDGNGNISQVVKAGGRTIDYTWDVPGTGNLLSATDGTNTWTPAYNISDDITAVVVT